MDHKAFGARRGKCLCGSVAGDAPGSSPVETLVTVASY